MRAKALLVSLVAIVGFIAVPAPTRAAGSATLTGLSVLLPNPGYWYPDEPVQLLSGIEYRSTGYESNDVTIAKIAGLNECVDEPLFGSCIADGALRRSERYAFFDLRGTLAGASGLCHKDNARSGYCETPLQSRSCGSLFCTEWFTDPQSPLPIRVALGANKDQFRAVLTGYDPTQLAGTAPPLGGAAISFMIDGGDGDDAIRLVDMTPPRDERFAPGPDSIVCGPGNDTVVTTIDVLVASDCESVSRI